jgi:hypothetical protein
MRIPIPDEHGIPVQYVEDGKLRPATLADAIDLLPPRPKVKSDIGTEIALQPVDRTSDDFKESLKRLSSWTADTDSLRSYRPSDPEDDYVNLIAVVLEQIDDGQFQVALVKYKYNENLKKLSFIDFEKVAAKVLKFCCPVCTCRKTGTGEEFGFKGDGWLSMKCSCGYSGYSRTLPELSFMAGSHPVGLPDEVAQRQSAVLMHVLTVEQVNTAKQERLEREAEYKFQSRVDEVCDAIAFYQYPPYTEEQAEEQVAQIKNPQSEHEELVMMVCRAQNSDRYRYRDEIRPYLRSLLEIKPLPDTGVRFDLELSRVRALRKELSILIDLTEVDQPTVEFAAYRNLAETLNSLISMEKKLNEKAAPNIKHTVKPGFVLERDADGMYRVKPETFLERENEKM